MTGTANSSVTVNERNGGRKMLVESTYETTAKHEILPDEDAKFVTGAIER